MLLQLHLHSQVNTWLCLVKDNCKTRQETFTFWDLVSLLLEIWQYDLMTYWATSIYSHWGRVTHICVGKLTIIGSDNGLSPGRRQAIIWTNTGILLIEPLGTNFSGNLIEILTFSFTNMRLKMSSAKWRPFWLGLNGSRYCMYQHDLSMLDTYGDTPTHCILTHRGRDKMDAISQTPFSNPFSWMKMYKFRLRFHWSLFPRV